MEVERQENGLYLRVSIQDVPQLEIVIDVILSIEGKVEGAAPNARVEPRGHV